MLKDPAAKLDYVIDWSTWLNAVSDTVNTITWSVSPSDGLVLSGETEVDGRATVWLNGGTLGDTYKVTCHILTSAGREDDRSFEVRVVDRTIA